VGLLAQLRFEASARTSSAFYLGVIELDVGGMDPSRSFVAIKQNTEDALRLPRLKSATTTPVRTFIFGLRKAPSSFKRTRSPGLSSIDVI
jgi:hypothetical protein